MVGTPETWEDARRRYHLLEPIRDGILILNPTGYIVYGNPAALRLLTVAPTDIAHTHGIAGLPPDQWETPFREVLATGQPRTARLYHAPSHAWFETRFEPTDEGVCLYLQAVAAQWSITEIIDSIDDAFFLMDRDGQYLYVNPQAAQMAASTPEELTGKNGWELFPKARTSPIYTAIQQAFDQQEPVHLETEAPSIGRQVSLSIYPQAEYVAVFTRDVTDRKATEATLQNRTSQIETLLDKVPMAVYLVDSTFCLVEVNPVVRAALGELAAELLGRDFGEVSHRLWETQFADRIVQIFRETLETGVGYSESEEASLSRAGEITGYFAWRVERITLPNGRFGLVCYAQDITEQVRTRQAIEESEKLFRTLGEAMPMHLWMIDANGHSLYRNPAWREYSGLTGDGPIHLRWYDLYHPDDVTRLRNRSQLAGQLGQSVEVEARVRRHDGVYRWFACRTVPIKDAEGKIVKWVGTALDIHEQKLAEQALRESEARLREAARTLEERNREVEALNERLQRAMTETHHRVKNNLQLIAAMLDLQRMASVDRHHASELARLSDNVNALAVIHDILTQEAKAGNNQEDVPANLVLERLLEAMRRAAPERRLTAQIADIRLTGKQTTTLALVANELASNAIKHGKGPIEISLVEEGNLAQLCVADDGPGFPEGFDATRAANTGLELVESIVGWDLRGQIAYTNRATGGSCVIVSFPLR